MERYNFMDFENDLATLQDHIFDISYHEDCGSQMSGVLPGITFLLHVMRSRDNNPPPFVIEKKPSTWHSFGICTEGERDAFVSSSPLYLPERCSPTFTVDCPDPLLQQEYKHSNVKCSRELTRNKKASFRAVVKDNLHQSDKFSTVNFEDYTPFDLKGEGIRSKITTNSPSESERKQDFSEIRNVSDFKQSKDNIFEHDKNTYEGRKPVLSIPNKAIVTYTQPFLTDTENNTSTGETTDTHHHKDVPYVQNVMMLSNAQLQFHEEFEQRENVSPEINKISTIEYIPVMKISPYAENLENCCVIEEDPCSLRAFITPGGYLSFGYNENVSSRYIYGQNSVEDRQALQENLKTQDDESERDASKELLLNTTWKSNKEFVAQTLTRYEDPCEEISNNTSPKEELAVLRSVKNPSSFNTSEDVMWNAEGGMYNEIRYKWLREEAYSPGMSEVNSSPVQNTYIDNKLDKDIVNSSYSEMITFDVHRNAIDCSSLDYSITTDESSGNKPISVDKLSSGWTKKRSTNDITNSDKNFQSHCHGVKSVKGSNVYQSGQALVKNEDHCNLQQRRKRKNSNDGTTVAKSRYNPGKKNYPKRPSQDVEPQRIHKKGEELITFVDETNLSRISTKSAAFFVLRKQIASTVEIEKIEIDNKPQARKVSIKHTPDEIIKLNKKAFPVYARYWRPRLKKKFPTKSQKQITELLKTRWEYSDRKTKRRYRRLYLEKSHEVKCENVVTKPSFASDQKKTKQKKGSSKNSKRPPNSKAKTKQDIVNWVQCDECQVWRILPDNIDITTLPARWFCKMNKDRKRNKCCIPQENCRA